MKIDLERIKNLIQVSESSDITEHDREHLDSMKKAIELVEFVGNNLGLDENIIESNKIMFANSTFFITKNFSFSSNK